MGGYLLNYNRWRSLYESTQLNEALDVSLNPVERGNKLTSKAFYPALAISPKTDGELAAIMTKTIGKQTIPELYVSSGTVINTDPEYRKVFTALVTGVMQYFGDKKLLDQIDDLAPKLKFTTTNVGKVQLYGPQKFSIDTLGKVSGSVTTTAAAEIKNSASTSTSMLSHICQYINGFNIQNWAAGSFLQIDPSKIVGVDNVTDLTGASREAYVEERGFLRLVSPASSSVAGGSIGKESTSIQGAQAETGNVEIAFTALRSDIDDKGVKVDANHPKVKEIGDKIIGYLGDNGVIDSMTLTSSASPEYGSVKNVAGWEKSYPKGTTGTADPGVGADDASKNMKLSYDRGVVFRTALYAYLGGHVNQNAIAVSWKISTDAPGGGKNITYSVATKSEAPQTIEKTTYQGAKVTVKQEDNALNIYKITYDASAISKNKTGLLVKDKIDYNNLKEGQAIIILAKDLKTKVGDTDKAEDQVIVSKMEDNNIYFNYQEKKDVLLPKDRYVRQYGKIDKTKNVEV
jgi:hypothetical protein